MWAQLPPAGLIKGSALPALFLFGVVTMPVSGSIFQGVTVAPCRDYVANEIMAQKPGAVYMPCAGRFGSAQAYINHGGNKETLYCSDICLFSSMLGYMFDKDKNLFDLGIINESLIQPDDSIDMLGRISAAMLALKYAQIKAGTQYGMNMRKEIINNRGIYLEQIKMKITSMTNIMAGSHYDIADVRDIMKAARNDRNAAVFVNVPTYSGGYERMFSGSGITWNEPDFSQFDYDEFSSMLDDLRDSSCHALVYVQKNLKKVPDGWRVVYAQPFGPDRTDYVISNRDAEKVYAFSDTAVKPAKMYPIFNDEEITENSVVSFVQVDEPTVLYYRDLFVHKLGTTTAEAFFLMLIDGKVTTAMGLALRDFYNRKSKYIGEVFGISRSSVKYKRLGKLFMMCLTSGDFKRFLVSKYNFDFRDPKGIKTSSLTTHYEGKTDRSVMKLVFREQLKNGQFRVIYQGDFRNDAYADCLKKWLDKWGGVKRNGNTA